MREDSKKMLPDGTGTPYLALFDDDNKPIFDKQNNKPLGIFVSSFFYEYNEEDVDSAEVVIDIDNPNIVDNPYLQNRKYLRMQWGWRYTTGEIIAGPLRRVIIMDHEIGFTESGVNFKLSCNDPMVLLKRTPPNYTDKTLLSLLQGTLASGGHLGEVELVHYQGYNKSEFTVKDVRTGETETSSYEYELE